MICLYGYREKQAGKTVLFEITGHRVNSNLFDKHLGRRYNVKKRNSGCGGIRAGEKVEGKRNKKFQKRILILTGIVALLFTAWSLLNFNETLKKTEKNKKSNTNFKSVFFISNINPILLVVIAVVIVAVILIILLMIIRKIKDNKRRRMRRNRRKQYTKVSNYNYKVSDRNRRTK